MVKRRTSAANSGDRGYTVGYRKPPIHSRFRPGQSGYPAGRRKGSRNLKTDVKRTLRMPVSLKVAGRLRKKSTQEAVLMVLREKALQGDVRALKGLLELALRLNNDATEQGPAQALSTDDQAILAAFLAERTGAAKIPPATAPANDATPTRRRRLKKRGRK